jgi:SET domain-containing protein
MALLEKHLFVKKSTIPNSGKGLFTKKFIPKGTRIVEYKGKVSTWKEVKDEDGKNGYIFYVTRNHVIDGKPAMKAFARYANDARGLEKIKGLNNNCDYVTEGVKAYIEAKKDIPAKSEIFVDYGKDYWKVIRENMKLWKQEEKEEQKEKEKQKKLNGVNRNGHAVKNKKLRNGRPVKNNKAGKKVNTKKTVKR